jgi:hypothetical protein
MKTISKLCKSSILIAAAGIVGFLFFSQQLSSQKEKTERKPDIHISVNKQLDKDGKITRYDSTYSYSWSSNGSDSINIDSLFNSYGLPFSNQSVFSHPNFIENDSLFFNFPNNPFFNDSSNNNYSFSVHKNMIERMNQMMKNQEALMEHFFNQGFAHPPIIRVPDNKESEQKAKPQQQSYNTTIEL